MNARSLHRPLSRLPLLLRSALILVLCAAAGWPAPVAPQSGAPQVALISLSADGRQLGGAHSRPDISQNGQFVAFHSLARLTPDDQNATFDVYVRDLAAGTTTRASLTAESGGHPRVNGSLFPSLSGDGRLVAFESQLIALGSCDTGGQMYFNVFVYDRAAGTTRCISQSVDGATGDRTSTSPAMAAGGRYVAFVSAATNLSAGDTNNLPDIYVRDLQTGRLERVSRTILAQADGPSSHPAISADGGVVVFSSEATNLVASDQNGVADIFRFVRWNWTIEAISLAGNGPSGWPAISADGGLIAFESAATNLVAGDTNGRTDVFLYDATTGATERVSVRTGGGESAGGGASPSISPDGRFIAFVSDAADLAPGDTNGVADVYVHDRLTGETLLASRALAGGAGDSYSGSPSVTAAGGARVAFDSLATDLLATDANNDSDVFMADFPLAATLEAGQGDYQSAAINRPFAAPLQVVARDAGGRALPGASVEFRAPAAGPGALFPSGQSVARAVADLQGVATAPSLTANGELGTFEVSASVAGAPALSFHLSNVDRAPVTMYAYSGYNQVVTVNAKASERMRVKVVDGVGAGIAGAYVAFTAPPEYAAFEGGAARFTALTDQYGMVTASDLYSTARAGNYVADARSGSLIYPFALKNIAYPIAELRVTSGDNQVALVNQSFAEPLAVQVLDSAGQPLEGIFVMFMPPYYAPGQASGTFLHPSGSSEDYWIVRSDDNGLAPTPPFVANDYAGAYAVRISVTGVPVQNTIHLLNKYQAASLAAVSGGGQSMTVNSPFEAPLRAVVRDQQGRAVANETIYFAAPTSGASGRFGTSASVPVVTDAAGEATAPTFTANGVAGSYIVRAHLAGLPSANFDLTNLSYASDFDLSVTGIEVSQSSQRPDNSLPLVADRPAMARVSIGVHNQTAVGGVTATLRGVRGGVELGALQPYGPAGFAAPLRVDRDDEAHTLNFQLPAEWVRAGDLTLVAEVNPGRTIPEATFANNRSPELALTFRSVPPLEVVVVPVVYQRNGLGDVVSPTLSMTNSFGLGTLMRMYPLSEVSQIAHPEYRFYGDLHTDEGWNQLYTELSALHQDEDPALSRIFYGVVPLRAAVKLGAYTAGIGSWWTRTAAGVDTNDFVAAHEIGHALGLLHAPPAPGYDLAFPYPSGGIGQTGLDPFEPAVRSTAVYSDMMSYGETPRWISDYHYARLYTAVGGLAPAAAPALGPEALLITGRIAERTGAATLYSALPVAGLSPPAGPGSGEYRLDLRDGAGNVIYSAMFSPANIDLDGTRAIHLVAPRIAGISKVQIWRDGALLAELLAAGAPPTLSANVEQAGGAGALTVRWQAASAGPPPQVGLRYSPDGGASWRMLAQRLPGTSFVLDPAGLPGGESGLIEVVASNSTETTVRRLAIGPVANKAPAVGIAGPAARHLHPGQPLVLSGFARDLEDGAVAPERMVWSSPTAGVAATGATLNLAGGLPAGRHRIVLTVTDSVGRRGMASVELSVGYRRMAPLVMR